MPLLRAVHCTLVARSYPCTVSHFHSSHPSPDLHPSPPPLQETYEDPLCPDCAAAWPTVLQVLQHYGPEKVRLTYHLFPLPYHTWSFTASMGATWFQQNNKTNGDQAALDYIAFMYASQTEAFYNTSATTDDMISLFANLVHQQFPSVSVAAFTAGLQDPNINEATRISFKFSAYRSTTGTPHFELNGSPIDDQLNDGTLADWEALIDPLLPGFTGEKKKSSKKASKKAAKKAASKKA
jgi:hypothetical protein